jgi:Bacterial flagellin N-terminal helical region
MSVSAVAANISPVIQNVLEMRRKLDDLQRQLGTGMKADTYAGLGAQSGLAIGLSRQLDAITSFNDTITVVGTRISVGAMSLSQIADVGSQVKSATLLPNFNIDGTGQTSQQKSAYYQLDQILSLLNTQVGDRFLFSGTSVDQASVETTDHILNGNGAQAGLKQLILERNQADLGATGLGRLVIPAAAGTNVSISEDVAGSAFGFKLATVNSTLTGAVVTRYRSRPPHCLQLHAQQGGHFRATEPGGHLSRLVPVQRRHLVAGSIQGGTADGGQGRHVLPHPRRPRLAPHHGARRVDRRGRRRLCRAGSKARRRCRTAERHQWPDPRQDGQRSEISRQQVVWPAGRGGVRADVE